jgi:hypothetical protein
LYNALQLLINLVHVVVSDLRAQKLVDFLLTVIIIARF